jgi:hypothetical protein
MELAKRSLAVYEHEMTVEVKNDAYKAEILVS